jgi:hypothetical protein
MTCYTAGIPQVYRASVNEAYNEKGVLQPIYPPPPTYNKGCPINVSYDTLPSGFPMRETILGPTSLKQLYKGPGYYPIGKPNPSDYPPQRILIPKDSMYGIDTGTYGPYGTRISYGAKMYPYQHRHPREISEYADTFIPVPNQFAWTRHTTVSDGAWGK